MPYTLSQNYEQLYTLLLAGEEVACYFNNPFTKTRELKAVSKSDLEKNNFIFPISDASKENFLRDCIDTNLSFIPQIDVKKVAGDAWDAARQEGYQSGISEATNMYEGKGYLPDVTDTKEQYLSTL